MIRGEFMDLEEKLELYYAKSYIKDDIKKCEATNDFSKIAKYPYDYFHGGDEFFKDYFSIIFMEEMNFLKIIFL